MCIIQIQTNKIFVRFSYQIPTKNKKKKKKKRHLQQKSKENDNKINEDLQKGLVFA